MQPTSLICTPIGYFHTLEKERYHLPKQAGSGKSNEGLIVLNAQQNFEQALADLTGFSRLWVIFWFHRNQHWKPKVLTPRGPPKRGLFATRSPHRPNPIGLSCVEILEISGLKIKVSDHDLIDQTPILDLKPYVEYADAWTSTKQGWLEDAPLQMIDSIHWCGLAKEQIEYLECQGNLKMMEEIQFRLSSHPLPSSNNRIVQIEENLYLLAYKSWRIHFKFFENRVEIIQIRSGYDQDTLTGNKISKWGDVELHRAFLKHFDHEKGRESH